MCGYINLCKSEPRSMSPDALTRLGELTDSCVREWVGIDGPVAMKWHVFGRHMCQQARWAGNPGCSANFADESENYSAKVRAFALYRPKFTETWLTKWVYEFLLSL
eukprot:3666292-Pyramimonas_sp.AAC.1